MGTDTNLNRRCGQRRGRRRGRGRGRGGCRRLLYEFLPREITYDVDLLGNPPKFMNQSLS